jgi:GDPmannose 4,6-dehydratase
MVSGNQNHKRCIMKKAFITGITGQDGSYLAEFLLGKGYEIHGLIRRSSTFNTDRIDHLYRDFHDPNAKLFLHYGDLSVSGQIMDMLSSINPDEIYHLGAQSHVRVSFDMPEYTGDVTGLGTLRILESIRKTGIKTKFYQASSSEMFGAAPPPQSEKTAFQPRSPYAAAKVYAYYIVQNYRDAYGIFATNGILFNHESPRRGETFVTRKITRAAAQIKLGLRDRLYLGNLEAKRDWGFSGDYVEAMWLMLQQEKSDDYVVATGETHSVREFVEKVFQKLDLDYHQYVSVDPRYFRPTEVDVLLGDASKARKALNWQPKVSFEQLVDMMVEADLELAKKEKTLVDAGFTCGNSERIN